MTEQTLEAAGRQVVFHSAAEIFFISGRRRREKRRGKKKIKPTQMRVCKETADGRRAEKVKDGCAPGRPGQERVVEDHLRLPGGKYKVG